MRFFQTRNVILLKVEDLAPGFWRLKVGQTVCIDPESGKVAQGLSSNTTFGAVVLEINGDTTQPMWLIACGPVDLNAAKAEAERLHKPA